MTLTISLLALALVVPAATGQAADYNFKNIPAQTDEVMFSSSAAQSRISKHKNLGKIAKQTSHMGGVAAAFGFAAKSDEAKFFLIGALYSEALAFQRSGDSKSVVDRLTAIENLFLELGAPKSLYNYISKVKHLAVRGVHSSEAMLDILSLFQPFFEDYAKQASKDKLILFQLGAWVGDLGLAAAAGDTDLLQQPEHLAHVIKEMKRMDAPKGVLKALDKIRKITSKKKLDEKDASKVLKQVKKIQTILG